MKKLFVLMLALVMCLSLLVGCGSSVEEVSENNTSMFIRVEHTGSWHVVYHRETKVMYAVSIGGYNCGNFTLLVNADGTPMLWED